MVNVEMRAYDGGDIPKLVSERLQRLAELGLPALGVKGNQLGVVYPQIRVAIRKARAIAPRHPIKVVGKLLHILLVHLVTSKFGLKCLKGNKRKNAGSRKKLWLCPVVISRHLSNGAYDVVDVLFRVKLGEGD